MEPIADPRLRRRGLLIVGLGVVVLSAEGVVIRSLSVDQWTILQWRGTLMCAALAAYIAVSSRGEFAERMFRLGGAGVLAAVLFATDNVLFVISLRHTNVANTLLMISTAPVFAAIFSAAFLRERVSRKTSLMIAIGLTAVGIILTADVTDSLLGNLAGLGAAICIAGTFVVLRGGKAKNLLTSMSWGAVLGALAATPFANLTSPRGRDVSLLLLLGAVIAPLAFGLLGTGPRYLPAPEVSMLILGETVLGPVWVWLAFAETPPARVLLGGALLFGALVVYYGTDIASQRRLATSVSIM